jgi:hypothetical protein
LLKHAAPGASDPTHVHTPTERERARAREEKLFPTFDCADDVFS